MNKNRWLLRPAPLGEEGVWCDITSCIVTTTVPLDGVLCINKVSLILDIERL